MPSQADPYEPMPQGQPPEEDTGQPPVTDAAKAFASLPHPAHTGKVEDPFPLAERGQYYEGLWSGYPNYKCPFCIYAVLGNTAESGDGQIELHILARIDQGSAPHMKALEKKGEPA